MEAKAHAAAEEQALWSSVLRKPPITDDGRHAVAEHKEIDELLDDLAARDMSNSGWLARFTTLRERYLHHIKEEEQEQFEASYAHLDKADLAHMESVFERRKAAEKADAEMTPRLQKTH